MYDPSVAGRWEAFMRADHVVRLVQREMQRMAPEHQCPFIVYANSQTNKVGEGGAGLVVEELLRDCVMLTFITQTTVA